MVDGHKLRKSPADTVIVFLDRISFTQVFLLWFIIILIFACAYFLLSLNPAHALGYRGNFLRWDLSSFMNSIYYSFITITTTGYGDISPNGLTKLLAVLEVVSGVIITGVLISKLVGVKQERILEEVYDISYEEIIDRLRSGLYLFRSDVNRAIEKIESGAMKPREVRDLWMIFSGLDTNLTNIKNFVMPPRGEKYYFKRLDIFRLELLLNSIQLSMNKMLELIKSLKMHELDWRNDLILTSIHSDISTVKEIIEYKARKAPEKKVLDKIESLRKTIWEIECEEKAEEEKPKDNENKEKDQPDILKGKGAL
ncbi:two pore domain potassium channel family protein [Candidatus Woesearchaeota archaeon]|nr:two pore domain potassium channel family protein [Candidatus Woesearchaeota archaeon]